ncbi:MAG: hypothetical protein ACO3ZY_12930, partial [Phycisphaerales bacterium]
GEESRGPPGLSAPSGLELVGLHGEHPEPARVRDMLHAIGVEMQVERGAVPRLVAAIRRADGAIVGL